MRNGIGDGYSHNIYIGNVRRLTLRFCYSHQSRAGQLLKSRAAENYITYNRLLDESGSNYEIDLPNGGRAYIIGNWIQQSPSATNSTLVSFGAEGPVPDSRLYLINNSLINDRWTGTFVEIKPGVDGPAVLVNNIFSGNGLLCNQANARLISNYDGTSPGFVDRKGYDYSLTPSSECINRGVNPGMAGDVLIVSALSLCAQPRVDTSQSIRSPRHRCLRTPITLVQNSFREFVPRRFQPNLQGADFPLNASKPTFRADSPAFPLFAGCRARLFGFWTASESKWEPQPRGQIALLCFQQVSTIKLRFLARLGQQ